MTARRAVGLQPHSERGRRHLPAIALQEGSHAGCLLLVQDKDQDAVAARGMVLLQERLQPRVPLRGVQDLHHLRVHGARGAGELNRRQGTVPGLTREDQPCWGRTGPKPSLAHACSTHSGRFSDLIDQIHAVPANQPSGHSTWETLWLAERSWEPMVTWAGLHRNSAARRWMDAGQVALNIRVWRSARMPSTHAGRQQVNPPPGS